MPPSAAKPRPLSPHLQVYKPQLTTIMSILHRATGIGLSLALPALVAWLLALAEGPETYGRFMECAHSVVGKLLLTGWAWAFCYHLCTGIRHLFWDVGLCLDIKQVYRTGWIAAGTSTILTLPLWAFIWGAAP